MAASSSPLKGLTPDKLQHVISVLWQELSAQPMDPLKQVAYVSALREGGGEAAVLDQAMHEALLACPKSKLVFRMAWEHYHHRQQPPDDDDSRRPTALNLLIRGDLCMRRADDKDGLFDLDDKEKQQPPSERARAREQCRVDAKAYWTQAATGGEGGGGDPGRRCCQVRAMLRLAVVLEEEGMVAQAEFWYRQTKERALAAAGGTAMMMTQEAAVALCNLSLLLRREGRPADALRAAHEAADQLGDPWACVVCGNAYFNGEAGSGGMGGKRDVPRAIDYYRKAAEAGLGRGVLLLGSALWSVGEAEAGLELLQRAHDDHYQEDPQAAAFLQQAMVAWLEDQGSTLSQPAALRQLYPPQQHELDAATDTTTDTTIMQPQATGSPPSRR